MLRWRRTMNPFVYSGPVSGDQVIDRDEQAKVLFDLAEAGQAARLSAPRRYGKTSLLYRLRDEAEKAGFNVVYVDFSRAVSIEDISVTVEEAYRRSLQGRVRQAAVSAIRYLRPRATAGVPGLGVEVSPQPDPEKVRLLGSLLDLPLRIHDRTGTRTLVVFDEFQELLSAGGDLDRLFRSRIQ